MTFRHGPQWEIRTLYQSIFEHIINGLDTARHRRPRYKNRRASKLAPAFQEASVAGSNPIAHPTFSNTFPYKSAKYLPRMRRKVVRLQQSHDVSRRLGRRGLRN